MFGRRRCVAIKEEITLWYERPGNKEQNDTKIARFDERNKDVMNQMIYNIDASRPTGCRVVSVQKLVLWVRVLSKIEPRAVWRVDLGTEMGAALTAPKMQGNFGNAGTACHHAWLELSLDLFVKSALKIRSLPIA